MTVHRNLSMTALAAALYYFKPLSKTVKIFLWLTGWLSTGGTYWLYLCYHTIMRDLRLLFRGLKILRLLAYVKWMDQTVPKMFRRQLALTPSKIMFINAIDGKRWTYTDVEEYSNRVANYFLDKANFSKGDSVALYMENRPEFVATWLGLAKVGLVPALINFNLRQKSLLHTLEVASCKGIIYSLEYEQAFKDIKSDLCRDKKIDFFCSMAGTQESSSLPGAIDIEKELTKCSTDREPTSMANSIHYLDPLLFIYTSGTTGLPKAVNISHVRQLFACTASHYTIGLREDDVVYCHLPLYHSSGGQVATASSLFFGTTTVIRKKFSASNFWKDCIKYNVTATQYIGEIARYLLAAPESPDDKKHRLRIMFGNGLRPQIWKKFVERFNIPNIAEFYGATEGNSNIINIENKPGAVGFVPVIFPQMLLDLLLPLHVIKVDPETRTPIRGSDGFCIPTKPGEPGEFIGKIVRGDPVKDFVGYKDKSASEKKVLQDVFRKGDLFFRSGDILIKDEFGYLYFKDRSGDTFRWKGENVSTSEVEATISNILELKDSTVYGVEIPNTEGRAGMVAIPAENEKEVDLSKLAKGLSDRLPNYARPIFVRFVKELHMTGTYKLKKTELQKEGYNRELIEDPLFFLEPKTASYVPLTKEMHSDIMSGKFRL